MIIVGERLYRPHTAELGADVIDLDIHVRAVELGLRRYLRSCS